MHACNANPYKSTDKENDTENDKDNDKTKTTTNTTKKDKETRHVFIHSPRVR